MTSAATIKVSKPLRDRINAGASARGLTAAELIVELLDRYEREVRLRAVGRAYAKSDDAYLDDVRAWASIGGDGS